MILDSEHFEHLKPAAIVPAVFPVRGQVTREAYKRVVVARPAG